MQFSLATVVRRAELSMDDFGDYIRLNDRFHGLLVELSNSPVIQRSIDRMLHMPFAQPGAFVLVQSELPESREILFIAVKLLPDSRGGSAYMWRLVPGDRMTITEPGNHFELARRRPEYLLLAGGIGITPIYTMALALDDAGAEFRLLYACRGRRDLVFGDELRERLGDRLQVFIDDEGDRVDLTAEIARLAPGGEFYVCGPIGLLEATKRAWQDSGRFASQDFTVKIPRMGREITVPRNQTMLDALENAGVEMIFDCWRGECGLCAVKILEVEGAVDHRDVFFSDTQKTADTHMCTCVSRAVNGSITIDTADRAG